jgi:fructoselysine 6-phosphate deglycase
MSIDHGELLAAAIKAVKERKPRNLYFVACGGSLAYMHNQQYIIDLETDLHATVISSNEFIHRNPKGLGKDSLVLLCSHSGNTPETVEAASFARKKGALTVAYSFKPDSPLWLASEYNLHYDWGPDADAYEHRAGMALRFIFGMLEAIQSDARYRKALETIKNLKDIFARGNPSSIPWARAPCTARHIHSRSASSRKCSGSIRRPSTRASISTVPSRSPTTMFHSCS